MRSSPRRARASICGASSAKTLARMTCAVRESGRGSPTGPRSETELDSELGCDPGQESRGASEGPLELHRGGGRDLVRDEDTRPCARGEEDGTRREPRVLGARDQDGTDVGEGHVDGNERVELPGADPTEDHRRDPLRRHGVLAEEVREARFEMERSERRRGRIRVEHVPAADADQHVVADGLVALAAAAHDVLVERGRRHGGRIFCGGEARVGKGRAVARIDAHVRIGGGRTDYADIGRARQRIPVGLHAEPEPNLRRLAARGARGALVLLAAVAIAVFVGVALVAFGLLAGALAAGARAAVALVVLGAIFAAGLLLDALLVGARVAFAILVLRALFAAGLLLAAAPGEARWALARVCALLGRLFAGQARVGPDDLGGHGDRERLAARTRGGDGIVLTVEPLHVVLHPALRRVLAGDERAEAAVGLLQLDRLPVRHPEALVLHGGAREFFGPAVLDVHRQRGPNEGLGRGRVGEIARRLRARFDGRSRAAALFLHLVPDGFELRVLVRGIELDRGVHAHRLPEAGLALVDAPVQDLHRAEIAQQRGLDRRVALVTVALGNGRLQLLDGPGVVDVEVVLFDGLRLERLRLFLNLRVRRGGDARRHDEHAGDDEKEPRQMTPRRGGERNTVHVGNLRRARA